MCSCILSNDLVKQSIYATFHSMCDFEFYDCCDRLTCTSKPHWWLLWDFCFTLRVSFIWHPNTFPLRLEMLSLHPHPPVGEQTPLLRKFMRNLCDQNAETLKTMLCCCVRYQENILWCSAFSHYVWAYLCTILSQAAQDHWHLSHAGCYQANELYLRITSHFSGFLSSPGISQCCMLRESRLCIYYLHSWQCGQLGLCCTLMFVTNGGFPLHRTSMISVLYVKSWTKGSIVLDRVWEQYPEDDSEYLQSGKCIIGLLISGWKKPLVWHVLSDWMFELCLHLMALMLLITHINASMCLCTPGSRGDSGRLILFLLTAGIYFLLPLFLPFSPFFLFFLSSFHIAVSCCIISSVYSHF